MKKSVFLLTGGLFAGLLLPRAAGAATYTIPGTSQQINFTNATNPAYQLSPAEITSLLNFLALYPAWQLAPIQNIQIGPLSGDLVVTWIPNGFSINVSSYVPAGSNVPFPWGAVQAAVAYYFYNDALPSDQEQEWNAYSFPSYYYSSLNYFGNEYEAWATGSESFLLSALRSGTPDASAAALFIASTFMDWTHNQITLFTSSTSSLHVPLSITNSVLAFGSFKFNLSNGQIVSYQYDGGALTALNAAVALPSAIAAQVPAAPPPPLPPPVQRPPRPVRPFPGPLPPSHHKMPLPQLQSPPLITPPSAGPLMVTSPGDPTEYVPLLSSEGQRKLQTAVQGFTIGTDGLRSWDPLLSPENSPHPVQLGR